MPEAVLLAQELLALDRVGARQRLIGTEDAPMLERIESLVVPALEWIGEGWEKGQLALAQVYMSGRICEELVDSLLPAGDVGRKIQPVIAVAALEDYHLLGKRVVGAVVRASGYAPKDFGRMEAADLVRRAQAERVDVLMISTLMLASALRVRQVMAGLRDTGQSCKVIVGGAPFRLDETLWQEVGADAMGWGAADAVRLIAPMKGAGHE